MENRINDFAKEVQDFTYPFLILEGTFGVGKTHLVQQTINLLLKSNEDVIVLYFDLNGCFHFHQIGNFLKIYSNLKGTNHIYEELDFFTSRFLEVINELNYTNPNLAKKIFDSYRFRDYFETKFLGEAPFNTLANYRENVNKIFQKNIDKRVLLKLFDTISEALIFSLFNIYHYNKSSNKIKLIFIFDNYELSAGIIDHWIVNHLYKYIENLSFGEYESYEIANEWKNKKANLLFDYKFVISTRYNFAWEKLIANFSSKQVKRILFEPLKQEQIEDFLQHKTTKISLSEIFSISLGIPLALKFIIDANLESLDTLDKSNYYEFIANRILERINPKLHNTVKLISIFNFFTEETIRCLPENYPFHSLIFKYFSQNKDLTDKTNDAKDSLQLNQHYKFFISNFLQVNEKENFLTFSSILENFNSNFEPLKNLPLTERKALRNLAYFKEFDLGETLREVFQEDYPLIEKFIKDHNEYFCQKDGIFSLKKELRKQLLEFNKLVDHFRYNNKLDIIKEASNNVKKKIQERINNFTLQKERNSERLHKCQIIKSKIKNEIQEIQKSIVSTENYLIDLNSQKYSTSRKYIWLPFALLALASIIVFLIGNNILYIFSESINIESIKGLGTTLKIFSILLFGIFLFLLIDLITSKDRKEAIQRLEEFIQKEEEKLLELKECLCDYKNAYKEFETEISELLKENEILDKEIEKLKRMMLIEYIDTT